MHDTQHDSEGTDHNRPNSAQEWKKRLLSLVDHSEPLTPVVRYGTSEKQLPEVHTIHEPIPEEATTVSPVYFVTDEQLNQQDRLTNPYRVSGNSTIAKVLQDQAEAAGRVLYPVIAESDSAEDGASLDKVAREVSQFAQEELEFSSDSFSLWYSGNRSVHVHAAAFVGEYGRDQIKELAQEFNQSGESVVELDTGLYSSKRQFRLPGVKHRDTGGRKVLIEEKWSHTRAFQASQTADRTTPETYIDVLNETVPGLVTDVSRPQALQSNPPTDDQSEEAEKIPPRLDAWRDYWRHNDHPLSPYANADADDIHSVSVIKVMGEPFERAGSHFVPCDVLGAIGGDGDYRVFGEERPVARPLKLSGRDIKKWNYEKTDYVVILGGRSRQSRIHEVDSVDAELLRVILKEDGRQAALNHLDHWEYDTGSTGMNGSCRPPQSTTSEGSDAEELQREIERKGLGAVDNVYDALFKISCRLLHLRGWDGTREWLKEVLGEAFDPCDTYDHLSTIVETYSEYDHVTVPPSPTN